MVATPDPAVAWQSALLLPAGPLDATRSPSGVLLGAAGNSAERGGVAHGLPDGALVFRPHLRDQAGSCRRGRARGMSVGRASAAVHRASGLPCPRADRPRQDGPRVGSAVQNRSLAASNVPALPCPLAVTTPRCSYSAALVRLPASCWPETALVTDGPAPAPCFRCRRRSLD
jgi:hypothetical protein